MGFDPIVYAMLSNQDSPSSAPSGGGLPHVILSTIIPYGIPEDDAAGALSPEDASLLYDAASKGVPIVCTFTANMTSGPAKYVRTLHPCNFVDDSMPLFVMDCWKDLSNGMAVDVLFLAMLISETEAMAIFCMLSDFVTPMSMASYSLEGNVDSTDTT